VPKKSTVLKLISWRHSFKRLNEEYEIATKKKQALDNLFETGRISQSTRDSFNDEIVAAIAEIEKQQKDLLTKMQLKIQNLESQIKTLEMLLANYEIQHVVGEIDEEIYQHEIALLSTGLETAKRELDMIIDAANQLCPPAAPVAEPSLPQESEAAPAVEVQSVETAPTEVEVATEPCSQEPAITLEEAAPIETPPVDSTEVAPAEASEVTEEISQEAVITVEEAAPAPEQPPLETEETVPVEASPAENTEVASAETLEATEDTVQEPVITVQEAESEELPAENAEDTPEETLQPIEEIPQEPVITIEETVSEQSSTESADVASAETPEAIEDTPPMVEEIATEANPRDAPQEAQQEIAAEPIAEQTECAEEILVVEESVADSTETHEERKHRK
jgi:hypothetical protein